MAVSNHGVLDACAERLYYWCDSRCEQLGLLPEEVGIAGIEKAVHPANHWNRQKQSSDGKRGCKMIENIWTFITMQFRFSQEGVSQSWLFWTLVVVCMYLRVVLTKKAKNN